MKNLRYFLVIGFATSAVFAHADIYTFEWTSSLITATGTIVTTDPGPGYVQATSGSITIISDSTGITSGTYNLALNPTFPDPYFDGHFFYDGLFAAELYPQITLNGLVFSRGPQDVNLWFNDFEGTPHYEFSANLSNGDNFSDLYNGLDGTFVAVPEPTSLAVLGLGALALVKRRKKSS